jgi:hypothetical protein
MENYDASSASGVAAVFALLGIFLIPFIIISVVMIIAHWKIYEKAGKPGWAAIVPIYNIIVLLEIVGKPVWWILLFLIPCVNIVFAIWTVNLLSKSFGQSEGFTVGLLLLGINILGIFRRKSATAPIPYSEFFEDINEINFDTEIEKAIAKHNYRFAVRLLYLRCLKKLSDGGLIEWQIDKTNSTYINELTDQRQREAFGILTRQFEYIWYGEFGIDGQVYKNIDSSFQDFNKQVA